jgi:signal transduction histidine kinase
MSDGDDARYLKTEFLARIAHELRGPAGVTLGALAEMEHAAGEPAQVATLLGMARRGIERTLRTADRLERTAQLEAGRVDWAREPRDLGDLVRKGVARAEALERRKGVSVEVTVPDGPSRILGDAGWLEFAFAEVTGNALRHARSAVGVSLTREGQVLRVATRDDGPGFTAPMPARFAPPSRRQGLALSLSLVREVALAHGGELTVDESTDPPTPGARVVLTFPVAS